MRRARIFAVVAVAAAVGLGLTACAKGDDGGNVTAFSSGSPTPTVNATSSSPSATASPSKSTSPSPSDPYTLSVEGIGPYRFDASPTVDSLNSAGKITDISTGGEVCPANYVAKGTGMYTDIQLLFTPEKKLDLVIGRGNKIHTPSGAKIGMTLTQLQTIYGDRGKTLSNGGAKAYIVKTSTGRALYFDLDLSNKVFVIIAGDGDRLETRFLAGADC